MSISPYYNDIELYLNDLLQFLNEYKWIYTTSNTKFIEHGTLSRIPSDWVPIIDSLSLEELNQIPFDYIEESWPISLQEFLEKLKKLKPSINEIPIYSDQSSKDEVQFLKGIKPKKIHEIYELSKEFARNCSDIATESTIVVDLGCGVGHLTQFLNRTLKYKVLGIEADPERVKTARSVQQIRFPESQESVKFVQHFIGSDSAAFMLDTIRKEFNLNEMPDLILTGLHTCGDLTIASLNLFLRMSVVRKLLIMPCCYHRMKYKGNSTEEFDNVPLSRMVRSAQYVNHIINRPFLRLAGQQTAIRWRNNTAVEHIQHGRNMFVRGVVEAVLNEDEAVVKNKNVDSTIDDLACDSDKIFRQYTLIGKHSKGGKVWSTDQKLAIRKLLQDHPNGGILSEFLVCLQTSIQSICENLVILDRLLYVREEAAELKLNVNISSKKIVKDDISPRCFVIVAEKN